jgi:hypothetical protein
MMHERQIRNFRRRQALHDFRLFRRTHYRNAVNRAVEIGLLEKTERRFYCAVSLPNILTYGKRRQSRDRPELYPPDSRRRKQPRQALTR